MMGNGNQICTAWARTDSLEFVRVSVSLHVNDCRQPRGRSSSAHAPWSKMTWVLNKTEVSVGSNGVNHSLCVCQSQSSVYIVHVCKYEA